MTATATAQVEGSTASVKAEVGTEIDWRSVSRNESWKTDHLPLSKRDYWRHMWKLDQGIKKGRSWFNGTLLVHFNNRDLIRLFTANLELTPHQSERAESYFLAQELGKWGIRKELVAWATCAYFVYSDDRDSRRCHPAITNDPDENFFDFAFELGFTHRELCKTYGKVESDVRLG